MDENEINVERTAPGRTGKNNIAESPQMSEPAMVGNVFIEPGKVFEDQRRKPRFLIGGILMILAISIFQIAFIEKFGLEKIVRARIESSKRAADLSTEEKEKRIEQQSGPIAKYVTYGAVPIVMIIVFLLGGLIYWLGANAMGGTASFLGGVAVYIYSSLAPALVFTAANIVVMFLKNPDDIDFATSQGGLLKANLGFFIDAKTMPAIAALLGSIDLFSIWGWVLAAIGLQKVAKISAGAAWAVVIMLALVGVAAKVAGALYF